MPRRKVQPQDRQRSARACDACKASKKRCDASQPCRLCVKKGTHDSCVFTPTPRDRRSRASAATGSRLTPSLAAGRGAARSGLLEVGEPSKKALQGDSDGEEEDVDTDAEEYGDSAEASQVGKEQGPVMLDSSTGDRVFVGNTAALSFLRFLQKTLKHYAGPSGFTAREHSHKWFEVTDPELGGAFSDDLDGKEKTSLTRCFLDASSGFLDLYTQDELAELITSSKAASPRSLPLIPRPLERASLASLYIMIAIGAQVRGKSTEDLMCASKYFSEGRKMAFEKMLEDPTVSLVRAFILMAFYMFGACRRNSAFMYLGVAAKSADILGLHAAAQHGHMSKTERDSRLRVAKSIRVFDIVCSSILGRRGSAPPVRSVDITLRDLDPHPSTPHHRDLALRANYESCTILESVVSKFVDDGALKPRSAEHFLQLLGEWSQALPVALRQRPRKGDPAACADSTTDRERMIANVHVAGTYYFGIILVTRQFLIQHIMPQLGGGEPKPAWPAADEAGTTTGGDAAHAVAELSRACIGAATYMAQMCKEALDAGVFLGNMCIVKAWVFAAGLVLGFALLTDESSNMDTREAFRGSREVLSVLGRLSAQAEQYYKILAAFSEAIDTYRRQMQRHRRKARTPYVEQILSYDDASTTTTGVSAAGWTDDGRTPGRPSHHHHDTPPSMIIDTTGQTQGAPAAAADVSRGADAENIQLPTPDFNVDDAVFGEASGLWNGTDPASSLTMTDFGPENWPSAADNELMLRILWDGYTMSFDPPSSQLGPRDLGV